LINLDYKNKVVFSYGQIYFIMPLASDNTEEELYNLSHFTNLQPMWALDNIKKAPKLSNGKRN
jgi:hypothetical protein